MFYSLLILCSFRCSFILLFLLGLGPKAQLGPFGYIWLIFKPILAHSCRFKMAHQSRFNTVSSSRPRPTRTMLYCHDPQLSSPGHIRGPASLPAPSPSFNFLFIRACVQGPVKVLSLVVSPRRMHDPHA